MKKILTLAVAAFALTVTSAKADDLMNDLAGLDLASINDASAELEEFDLDGLDVDQLAAEAGEETDAIEACFRRIGFRRGGWGGWGYGFRRFGCGYGRFGYGFGCHRPLYCYRPIIRHCYTHCVPVISNYWGCY